MFLFFDYPLDPSERRRNGTRARANFTFSTKVIQDNAYYPDELQRTKLIKASTPLFYRITRYYLLGANSQFAIFHIVSEYEANRMRSILRKTLRR